jgi:hypothetical protein
MKLPKVSGSMDVSALARVRLLGPYRGETATSRFADREASCSSDGLRS